MKIGNQAPFLHTGEDLGSPPSPPPPPERPTSSPAVQADHSHSDCSPCSDSRQHTGIGSAFGKTILLGEHAVVYGWPALAAAIGQCVDVSVHARRGPAWVVAPDVGLEGPLLTAPSTALAGSAPGTSQSPSPTAPLHRALALALDLLNAPASGLCLHIRGTIPVGRGAGSSAALTIASLRALASYLDCPLSDARLLELGFRIEQEFHGRASGIDHTVAALGGVLEYSRGTPPRLRTLTVGARLPLLLVDAGPAPSTAHQVALVAEKLRMQPDTCQAIFEKIGGLVEQGVRAVEVGDLETLAAAMNENHSCLQALGVSSSALDACICAARRAGATGAKLTGAGGGGLALALCPDGTASVAQQLRALGHTVYETCLGHG